MYLPSKLRSKYVRVIALTILIALPFRNAVEGVFISLSRQLVFNPTKISSVVTELKKNNLSLLLKVRELEYLKLENTVLKQALQFKTDRNVALVGVQAISFDPSNWRRVITLDAGKSSGLKVGQYALDEQGMLVGRVVEAAQSYSRLMLIDDPAFSLPVFIGEKSLGLLRGSLNGAQILYIENIEQIKEKDKIWCKIPAVAFPVYIGEVSEIRKRKDSLFLDTSVKLYSSSPLLRTIFIVK